MRLLLIAVVVVALLAIVISAQPPARRRAWVMGSAITALIVLLLWLALTGRLHWLAALFASLLPFARRLLPLLRYLPWLRRFVGRAAQAGGAPGAAGAATGGRQSEVATAWLRMRLDHDSGAMDGEVLQGELAGRRLGELSFETLIGLLERLVAIDTESANLLRAYLEREHADAWQRRATGTGQGSADGAGGGAGTSGCSDREEALRILGLDDQADEAQIVEAHRRLMQKLHPDHGGSDYLASKVNAARDLLLGERRRRRAG